MRDMASVFEIYDGGQVVSEEKGGPALPSKPLDPPNLTVIQEGIALADLSEMIRQQPVCAVVQGQRPQVVFHEIYTSIESLRQSLMPNVNLHANRWLFQALTEYLDGRTIEYLSESDDATTQSSFSVNLNVSTLLSPEFLDLAELLSGMMTGNIIVELQLVDVYSDLGNFYRARDLLRDAGIKFCLDGISHLALPLIDRKALGFDLVKLIWHRDLHGQLNGAGGDKLRQAAKKIGPERMILARCDSEQALEAGRSLGVALYQGRLIDDLCEGGAEGDPMAEDSHPLRAAVG